MKRLESIMIDDPPPPEINDYFDRMANHSQDLASKLKKFQKGSQPLRVAVVGSFNAGKSSFINHFLQNEICPTNIRPTTSVVTRFVYGSMQKILIQEPPEKKYRKIDHIEYKRRVQEAQELTTDQIMHFTIVLPNDALKGLELMDTPGFNNQKNPSDGTITESIIPEIDVFLYLSDINNGELPGSDKKKLELLKSKAPDTRILLVLNKADSKPPEKTHKIKAEFQTKYESVFNSQIITYSTKCERNDIASRQDITNLLTDLCKDAAGKNYTTLVREIQKHFDRRLVEGAKIETVLDNRVSENKRNLLARNQRFDKIVSGLHKTIEMKKGLFRKELLEAIHQAIYVEKVSNTNFFNRFFFGDKGRIVYRIEILKKQVTSAEKFIILEQEMNRFNHRLLEYDIELKQVKFESERKAYASAAHKSVETLKSIGCEFESVEISRIELDKELNCKFDSIAESTWTPIQNSILIIIDYTRDKYHDKTRIKEINLNEFNNATKSLQQTYKNGIEIFNQ